MPKRGLLFTPKGVVRTPALLLREIMELAACFNHLCDQKIKLLCWEYHMRQIVTEQQVRVALALATRVESGAIRSTAAIDELMNQHGFTNRTANAYLYAYLNLRAGKTLKATVNVAAMQLMLENVAALGNDALFTALQALWRHIFYLETLPNSRSKERGLRSLHQVFTERLAASAELEPPPSVFVEEVGRSIADSDEARLHRLRSAPKNSKAVIRLVRQYERNPDVVAQALIRANGSCELCEAPAPFKRRSNGTPYLEVHHIVQLAHGGDDTVENAQALCPNCHRNRHFGEEL